MRRRADLRAWLLVALLGWQLPLSAAVVKALVPPAWLQRGASYEPLVPGWKLLPGDVIETGEGARLRLLMDDGSLLKLGSDSRLLLGAAPYGQENSERLLHLDRGVLRISSSASGHYFVLFDNRPRLELTPNNEVWMKFTQDVWRVCRIEGFVALEKGPEEGFVLNHPRQCFEWLSDRPEGEIQRISFTRQRSRLRESNIHKGDGILSDGGEWTLYLGSFDEGFGESRLLSRFRQLGFPVEQQIAYFSGEKRHRLMIRGFYEEAEARSLARRFRRLWRGKTISVEQQ